MKSTRRARRAISPKPKGTKAGREIIKALTVAEVIESGKPLHSRFTVREPQMATTTPAKNQNGR